LTGLDLVGPSEETWPLTGKGGRGDAVLGGAALAAVAADALLVAAGRVAVAQRRLALPRIAQQRLDLRNGRRFVEVSRFQDKKKSKIQVGFIFHQGRNFRNCRSQLFEKSAFFNDQSEESFSSKINYWLGEFDEFRFSRVFNN